MRNATSALGVLSCVFMAKESYRSNTLNELNQSDHSILKDLDQGEWSPLSPPTTTHLNNSGLNGLEVRPPLYLVRLHPCPLLCVT